MKDFVSILVPTKNRPNFLGNIIRNFLRQDYGVNNMELLIGDDGLCEMEKILPDEKYIKYHKWNKITLGDKRNELIKLAKGNILIFFDDDDYYPYDKVSACVEALECTSYDIVGSSIMYVYFPLFGDILKYGPWGKNHSTCATLAFRKKYGENNKFDSVNKAEEKSFLNNYKNDLFQMDSLKAILVIAHNNNTVDKYKFRKMGKKTELTLDSFGLTESDKNFYLNLVKK